MLKRAVAFVARVLVALFVLAGAFVAVTLAGAALGRCP